MHFVHVQYKQSAVQEACERWLQLHMVPQLSLVINLRDLPFELLEKTLLSSRLFTWNEYALFKLICHWIFLQLHPHVQVYTISCCLCVLLNGDCICTDYASSLICCDIFPEVSRPFVTFDCLLAV